LHDLQKMDIKDQYLLQIYLLMNFIFCSSQFSTQEDLILHLEKHFKDRKLAKKRTLESQFSDANKAFKKSLFFIGYKPH